METLKKANVVESVRQDGFTIHRLYWRKPIANDSSGGKRLGDIPEAHGIGNGVIYPQRDLTKLLYRHAIATGFVIVHFGRELCAIQEVKHEIDPTSRALKWRGGKLPRCLSCWRRRWEVDGQEIDGYPFQGLYLA